MKEAYDAEAFRALGHRVIDLLADHLRAATAGERKVLPWRTPAELAPDWPTDFPGGADVAELIARAVSQSIALHHPRYIGHQVSAPLPAAALCELVSALLNNGMAVYEMGPAATAIERAVVGWMAGALGMPAGADGVLTSGGSLGNLTALLAAAHLRGPGKFLVGATGHYSIARAVDIVGREAVLVPCDERGAMQVAALPPSPDGIIGVVASACSTATGAYDPLPAIADYCAAHRLWLHVDGAHGAAAALSPKYRHLVAGIERADSVVWDAHKMMLVPALVTGVLFRDARGSWAAFEREASYLFDPATRAWDTGTRTLECTKRMMGLGIYATLASLGAAGVGDYVARTYDLARGFVARLRERGFEAIEPDSNIVCFRRAGASDAETAAARAKLVESGDFYIVKTSFGGRTWLRVTIINPLTEASDLEALIDAVSQ